MRLRLRPSLSLLAAAAAMRRPMMTANLVQPRDAPAGLSVLEQTEEVKSPPRDKKQYRWLRASNGLRVLLVHDPDTEKAAAALEVHAGHFSDPDERPGLAHFTEHMMLLAVSIARPRYGLSASADEVADWPRPAEAWGSLRHGLTLKAASGAPAGSEEPNANPNATPNATPNQVPRDGELSGGGRLQSLPAEARRLVQRLHRHGDHGLPLRAAGES